MQVQWRVEGSVVVCVVGGGEGVHQPQPATMHSLLIVLVADVAKSVVHYCLYSTYTALSFFSNLLFIMSTTVQLNLSYCPTYPHLMRIVNYHSFKYKLFLRWCSAYFVLFVSLYIINARNRLKWTIIYYFVCLSLYST